MSHSRYQHSELSPLWDQPQLNIDRLHQAAVLCARHRGHHPLARALELLGAPPVEAVAARESVTHHDVAAYVEETRSRLHPSVNRRFHVGLTSSNLSDTALAILLDQSQDVLRQDILGLHQAMLERCSESEFTLPGMTHGQPADPIMFTQRVRADARPLTLLIGEWESYHYVSAAGPVGDQGDFGWSQELLWVGGRQCVPRHYLAHWLHGLVDLSLALEQIGLNLRLAARFPYPVVTEGTTPGQMGSSSMPDKFNPIGSEQACGLAKLVRANARAVQDASILWEERDISHSSVERVALRDAVVLAGYVTRSLTEVYRRLRFHPEQAAALVQLHPQSASEVYQQLVQDGASNATAYATVRAMSSRVADSDQ